MKIGIDVDEVLLDYEREMLVRAEIFDIEKCKGKGKINLSEHHIQNMYDWSKAEKEQYILENLGPASRASGIMAGAKEVLEKLREMGHELIIISARGIEADEMIDIVVEKFDNAGIKFDKCYWKEHEKIDICKKENIDIMIDDSPNVCKRMIDNKIKAIYFKGVRSDNFKLEPSEYLVEVTNWGEVYRYMKGLE